MGARRDEVTVASTHRAGTVWSLLTDADSPETAAEAT
jgi:hypothetical protein